MGGLPPGGLCPGVSVLVGGCLYSRVSLSRGVCLPSPVNRQTGTKHYLLLRSVKMYKKYQRLDQRLNPDRLLNC